MNKLENAFRTAMIGGFDRQDVLSYLEKLGREHHRVEALLQQRIEKLEEECASLRTRPDSAFSAEAPANGQAVSCADGSTDDDPIRQDIGADRTQEWESLLDGLRTQSMRNEAETLANAEERERLAGEREALAKERDCLTYDAASLQEREGQLSRRMEAWEARAALTVKALHDRLAQAEERHAAHLSMWEEFSARAAREWAGLRTEFLALSSCVEAEASPHNGETEPAPETATLSPEETPPPLPEQEEAAGFFPPENTADDTFEHVSEPADEASPVPLTEDSRPARADASAQGILPQEGGSRDSVPKRAETAAWGLAYVPEWEPSPAEGENLPSPAELPRQEAEFSVKTAQSGDSSSSGAPASENLPPSGVINWADVLGPDAADTDDADKSPSPGRELPLMQHPAFSFLQEDTPSGGAFLENSAPGEDTDHGFEPLSPADWAELRTALDSKTPASSDEADVPMEDWKYVE